MLDGRGEICPETHHDSGIFQRGARHVSRLQLLLWDLPPTVLSSSEREEMALHVSHLSNEAAGEAAPTAGAVHLERSTVLTPTACLQQLSFTSYGATPLSMPLTLAFDADFRDIFELRGVQRRERGRSIRRCDDQGLIWLYHGLDGEDRRTALRLSQPVEAGGDTHVRLRLELDPRHMAASLVSDNPAFNSWLSRSYSEVHLLSSALEHGLYPYAGVPWFSCPFAFDGEGAPCEVRSSNAGHCLWTGIARPEAAAAIARQLLSPSSFNGWGVRSLDDREERYNPMSYHNGSVWPHDNALIGMGLARYGHDGEAMPILTGLFDAAKSMPMLRLPELFCGFPRREDEGPTLYPVACSPQAWASGTVFGLLEAITGMGIGRDRRSGRVQVLFRNPTLPRRLDWLEISGLRLGEEEIDLRLHRGEHDTGVLVRRRTEGVDVVITK